MQAFSFHYVNTTCGSEVTIKLRYRNAIITIIIIIAACRLSCVAEYIEKNVAIDGFTSTQLELNTVISCISILQQLHKKLNLLQPVFVNNVSSL